MRNPDRRGYLSFLFVSLAMPALALGAPADAGPPPWSSRPCVLVVDPDLKPIAELAWAHSATFREQCRVLAAGRASVIVRAASPRDTLRAQARIGTADDGTILALVRVNARINFSARVLEYLGHELEHVVERVEGVDLLMQSRLGGTGVVLVGGAFETRRAIEAGLRVAREVEDALKVARAKTE